MKNKPKKVNDDSKQPPSNSTGGNSQTKAEKAEQLPPSNARSNSQHKAEKPDLSRCSITISIISLVVAAVGGVPGFLALKSYIDRSSARINFDVENSIICKTANSPAPMYEDKLAILLYSVTIVGTGNDKFVAYDVVISVGSNGIWYNGIRFIPVKHTVTDKNGSTSRVLQAYVGVKKPTIQRPVPEQTGIIGTIGDTVNFCEWDDFSPGASVGFGEPTEFDVANYFPNPPFDLSAVDRMRITVLDYLGNAYSEEYEFPKQFLQKRPTLYLDLNQAKFSR
jgi:hypothetical protein